MQEKTSIACYKLIDKILTQARWNTIHGIGLGSDKIFMVGLDNYHDIGETVVHTFEDCKLGIPHPTQEEFRELAKAARNSQLFKLAKVKSWKAFGQNSVDISVYFTGQHFDITPTRNEKPGKWSFYLPEKTILIPKDAPLAELGKAVLDAFELCEKLY